MNRLVALLRLAKITQLFGALLAPFRPPQQRFDRLPIFGPTAKSVAMLCCCEQRFSDTLQALG